MQQHPLPVDFTDKTVVVTGGSDGIGLAIAAAFGQCGARVVVAARDRAKLDRAVAVIPGPAVGIVADLAHSDGALGLARETLDLTGGVDVLVNNAGMARFTPFATVGGDELEAHLTLNLKSPFLLAQALLPALVASQGSICNISSYFADRMLPGRPSTVYSMTKGGLDSLTKALAFELGPLGVRVNAIAPGTVESALVRGNLDRLDPVAREKFLESVRTIYPLGRIGQPAEIAPMAVFLASPGAAWITGAVFPVDGGLTTN